MKKLKEINRDFWLDEIKEYVIYEMTENEELIDEYLGCLQILFIDEWDVDGEDPAMRHHNMVEFEEAHQLEEYIGKEEVKKWKRDWGALSEADKKNTHETALYMSTEDGYEYLTSLIFGKENFMECLLVDCDECGTKVAFCDSTSLEDDDWTRICKDCS